ncbi:ribonuclease H-like domain-containing protein [Tanacetum coccineum]
MTRSSPKELLSPFENPEQKFCSKRRLFDTPGLIELNSPELDHIFDIKEQSEEGERETMTETMEQYMSKTRENYGSGITRPMINQDTPFELKGQFLNELHDNTFSGLEHEDANEHIKKVLEIVDLFHIPKVTQDQIMLRAFPVSLTEAASRWLRNQPSGSITTWECPQHYLTDMQEVILFYNGPDVPTRQILDSKGAIPSKTAADTKIAIQEMVEYSQKWHKEHLLGPECTLLSSDANYARDDIIQKIIHKRKKGKLWKKPTIHSSVHPINLEDSIEHQGQDSTNEIMEILPKRHEENSNIIKEIRASTDTAMRNQGALIKTLEIQIGQMSKVLQERGFRSLPSSTEMNPRDQVKSISTAKADFSKIRPLVDLGASMSVMPFSTYTNLGLGILSHTRLTIELADRTIKQPRGIAKNVLVRIGKFIFPLDFMILIIPEDNDVPLNLERPFLSTAHSKIDVFKRKITLRVREEKLIFKSVKPATSIIKRVFVIKSLDSKTNFIGEGDESFEPIYGGYIELNDLDTPLETKTDQDDFVPIFVKTGSNKMEFSCVIGYKYVITDLLPSLPINLMSKSCYYSIFGDKDEGKSHAGTLIDIPVFVGSFFIISGFTIIDDDDMTKDVVLGMKFYKKYASYQTIMKRFALENNYEQIIEDE